MKKMFFWAVLSTLILTSVSCSSPQTKENNATVQTAKYVFYFIGDGMSTPEVQLTEQLMKLPGYRTNYETESLEKLDRDSLIFRHFPIVGQATNYAENRYITGSAAAATALSCGHKTTINTIGKNGTHDQDYKTLGERAKEAGMKVGVITSVSIDHATPAGFYAHVNTRHQYQDITLQLIQSGFDYFGGGTVNYGKFDTLTYPNYLRLLKAKGYTYITDRAQLLSLNNQVGPVIATIPKLGENWTESSTLPYALDLNQETNPNNQTTLADFTQGAIQVLDNAKGFFLMVEGGKIDWAMHANDVGCASADITAMDNAVKKAYDFYLQHPDETLIIVTGDHETGGLALGYKKTHYESNFRAFSHQKMSTSDLTTYIHQKRDSGHWTFDQALEELQDLMGINDESIGTQLDKEELLCLKEAFNRSIHPKGAVDNLTYTSYDPLTVEVSQILAHKAGVACTTFSHTALPIAIYAIGAGSERFKNSYDNTDIPKKIAEIGGYNLDFPAK